LRKVRKGKRRKNKEEGRRFYREKKLSTLPCPTNAYTYSFLQVWATIRRAAGGGMSDAS